MNAQQLHDALNLLPDDLIEEAGRQRSRKPIPLRRYAAFAASFALVLSGALFCARLFSPKGAMEEAAAAPAAMQFAAADAANAESAILGVPETGKGAPTETQAAAARSGTTAEQPMEDANTSAKAEATANEPADAAAPTIPEKFASEDTVGISLSSRQIETPMNPRSTACFSSHYRVTVLTSREELEAYQSKWAPHYDLTGLEEAVSAYDDSWFAEHDLLVMVLHAEPVGSNRTIPLLWNTREEDKAHGWDWMFLVTWVGTSDENGETTVHHLLAELEKGLLSPEDSIVPVFDAPEGM